MRRRMLALVLVRYASLFSDVRKVRDTDMNRSSSYHTSVTSVMGLLVILKEFFLKFKKKHISREKIRIKRFKIQEKAHIEEKDPN